MNVMEKIFIVIGCFLLLPLVFFLTFLTGPFFLIIAIFLLFKYYRHIAKHTKIFQEKIVIPLLKKLEFIDEINETKGIEEEIYKVANFRDDKYNNYSNKFYIMGNLKNAKIEFSKARTTEISSYTDSEGNTKTTTKTIFKGLVFVATLKRNITDQYIHIFNDKDDSKILKFNLQEEKINMDSIIFEQEFDVYSTDSIRAFEILTSDVMERLIDEKRNNNLKFDISIIQNMIIMRIHDKWDMFEMRNIEKKGASAYGGDVKHAIVQDVQLIENIFNFMNDITNGIYNII